MQTLTLQEEGACVGTEMSGGQSLPICRTGNLNPPRLTSRRSQPPLPLRLQSTPRVGGGSAFYVRQHMRLLSIIVCTLLLVGCASQRQVALYNKCREIHPGMTRAQLTNSFYAYSG